MRASHPESDGLVGVVGERRTMANQQRRASVAYRGNGNGGGVSEHGGSIPRPGRKRAARGSSWARRWSSGRRVMAALGGGRARGSQASTGGRGERARERKK
jgi:hypothetical protein